MMAGRQQVQAQRAQRLGATCKAGAWLLLVTCLLASCQRAPLAPLGVANLRLSAAMPGMPMRAAYFDLTNNSDAALTITRVESPDFGSVTMHQSELENGISHMRPIGKLVVPAHATIQFQPGGKHLMLSAAKAANSNITLQFYSDDSMLLSVQLPTTAAAR